MGYMIQFDEQTLQLGWFNHHLDTSLLVQVAVEHAIGELMFNINLLSFSVTDEEAYLPLS